MKRWLMQFTVCTAIALMVGCGNIAQTPTIVQTKKPISASSTKPVAIQPTTSTTIAPLRALRYFPFEENIHSVFKGSGNEYASYTSDIEYLSNGTIQEVQNNGGTNVVNVYKQINGNIVKTYMQGESYQRQNMMALSNMHDVVIKEPIQVGTSWTLSNGFKRSITAVAKELVIPFGRFKSIEITTNGKDSTQREYYVADLGLVKREFQPNNSVDVIKSELEIRKTDTPKQETVKLYYPDFNNDRLMFETRKFDLFTNQNMQFVFQKELKIIPKNSKLIRTLTTNTKIRKITVDKKNNAVHVDFSPEILKEMNAGSGLESLILQSITNTFGEYYEKPNVLITVDGKNYSSGHFLLKPGEYFHVDLKNAKEYN